MKIQMNVNGSTQNLDLEEEMPILWALRDKMGLTGTKYGCGKGLCGVCTVHLDGVAIRSCVTPVSEANGKKITSIEGLSKDGKHQNSLIFLGLLVGFAIGYDIFEGNIYGGDTLIPVIKK